jgi:hypothetical protein
MKMSNTKFFILLPLIIIFSLIIFSGGYTWWNNANPERTCASCHEISPAVTEWQHSAHRNFLCSECHGTTLSNGWHSIKEKTGMLLTHISDAPEHEQLGMNEAQVLEVTERCIKCHQREYARWSAGSHSTTYADIFLNEEHNEMEPPYWDCFRCHGMYYDGDINDLMEGPETDGNEWNMIQPEQAGLAAIPCLACHKTHTANEPLLSQDNSTLGDNPRNSHISWYIRTDKRHRRADKLKMVEMVDESGRLVQVSHDPATKLCVQCHSSNAYHMVGTEDDRTPTGIHEGISCAVCHDPHSHSTENACNMCHTEMSRNCKLDVRTMNTTFSNPESENNIHFITCNSCHEDSDIM